MGFIFLRKLSMKVINEYKYSGVFSLDGHYLPKEDNKPFKFTDWSLTEVHTVDDDKRRSIYHDLTIEDGKPITVISITAHDHDLDLKDLLDEYQETLIPLPVEPESEKLRDEASHESFKEGHNAGIKEGCFVFEWPFNAATEDNVNCFIKKLFYRYGILTTPKCFTYEKGSFWLHVKPSKFFFDLVDKFGIEKVFAFKVNLSMARLVWSQFKAILVEYGMSSFEVTNFIAKGEITFKHEDSFAVSRSTIPLGEGEVTLTRNSNDPDTFVCKVDLIPGKPNEEFAPDYDALDVIYLFGKLKNLHYT